MRTIVVDLVIPADEYLRVYQGAARAVSAVSREGLRVQFPVSILQSYVTHEGVRGSFAVTFDEANKFQSIRRLEGG